MAGQTVDSKGKDGNTLGLRSSLLFLELLVPGEPASTQFSAG